MHLVVILAVAKDQAMQKPNYGTAGYENPKPLCGIEKGNVYPHLLNLAAVPPTLEAEVRKKDNKHKISGKQITQN